ncbi:MULTISPECIES: ArsR/SmtB family transcription factor [Nocardia]|uniref:ArsR/SmtB family transcription factor n=1 Tax=Nocardia TaxID=1817 RepID=UPI0018947A4C|nr:MULTISPECIES: metalloregulator ArsR/SmtB family transcription factor [Nocardia]MBF6352575.1 winged helix-turn-helix transcriptional regulator [Nocardia flavorosea]
MASSVATAVFEALADPVRRTILQLLAAGEQPAGALVTGVRAYTPISQPAVSQHLKVLREAGLLRVRPAGTQRIYTLDPDGIAAAQDWLAALLDPVAAFAQPLDALATEVARGKRERRRQRPEPGGAERDTRSA